MDGGGAPSRFATDFRRVVTPVLKREAERLGSDLADDRLSFPEAMAELMSLAYRRGAGYLPEPIQDELRDWLSATLLDEAEGAAEALTLVLGLLREPSRDVIRQRIREHLDNG